MDVDYMDIFSGIACGEQRDPSPVSLCRSDHIMIISSDTFYRAQDSDAHANSDSKQPDQLFWTLNAQLINETCA